MSKSMNEKEIRYAAIMTTIIFHAKTKDRHLQHMTGLNTTLTSWAVM